MNANPGLRPGAFLRRSLAALALAFCIQAAQADDLSVASEVVLDVPPDAAWALVGDFKGLDRWHPAIAASRVDGSGRAVGDIRVLTLSNGGKIKEELLAYDHDAMRYEYRITASPLPVADYVAAIAVRPAGEGKSRVLWQSTFDAHGAEGTKAREVISGIYTASFEMLAKFYNR